MATTTTTALLTPKENRFKIICRRLLCINIPKTLLYRIIFTITFLLSISIFAGDVSTAKVGLEDDEDDLEAATHRGRPGRR